MDTAGSNGDDTNGARTNGARHRDATQRDGAHLGRTIEMTGLKPSRTHDPRVDRASHVPNPNIGIGFLIVANPDADMGRIRRLRWVAMIVRFASRIFMLGIVVVVLPLLFATASWLSNGQLPPRQFLWGLAVVVLLTLAAIATWWLSHRIEQTRRELASIDGIDRNKPRHF